MTGFIETDSGSVPQVKTVLSCRDHLGTVRARIGIDRNQYKVNPGLYCVGSPAHESPIFVTANYKLSFDALRKELPGIDAWILVVDTRGINVWCAAGKGTFSADEVALQVKRAGLDKIVSHRELILPQFAATGVASRELKKKCGFKGVFGPLKAQDIPHFMKNNKKADEAMRSVTFTFGERLILVPVEIVLIWKLFVFVTLAIFILSGIGPEIYSLQAAWTRGFNGCRGYFFCPPDRSPGHTRTAALDSWSTVLVQRSSCRWLNRLGLSLDNYGRVGDRGKGWDLALDSRRSIVHGHEFYRSDSLYLPFRC